MKAVFADEVKKTSHDVLSAGGDFRFAAVADSHLDNSVCDFLENIAEVDKAVSFDCMIHLGDFLNGSFSERYTYKVFGEQIKLFSDAIKADFYPTQGNHDGFTDLEKYRTHDMATDGLWRSASGREPCYFVDFEDKKIRLVCVCSYSYTYDGDKYIKGYGVAPDTPKWLYEEALKLDKDWTVILFSHDVPFSVFPVEDIGQARYRDNGKQLFDAVISARDERGFDIAGWFIGHFHDDFEQNVCGINFILVGSQTAYVPTLWGSVSAERNGRHFERRLGTVTEDLWDAVVLDKKERRLKLFRFGAGIDRELDY